MKRTKEEALQTRADIIEAALDVFSEQGYYGTKLSVICERAKITKGALYWHFDSKEDLIINMLRHYSLKFGMGMRSIQMSELPPQEKIEKLWFFAINMTSSSEEFAKMTSIFMFKLSEDVKKIIFPNYEGTFQIIEIDDTIEKGLELGIVNPRLTAREYSSFFKGLMKLLVSDWLQANKDFSLEERGRRYYNTFIKDVFFTKE